MKKAVLLAFVLLMVPACLSAKARVNIEKLIEKAQAGGAQAQYDLGLMYYEGKEVRQNYEEAVKWYRKSAEQGHVKAQNNLGFMYEKGYGTKRNDEEAVKWYRKAAETRGGGGVLYSTVQPWLDV